MFQGLPGSSFLLFSVFVGLATIQTLFHAGNFTSLVTLFSICAWFKMNLANESCRCLSSISISRESPTSSRFVSSLFEQPSSMSYEQELLSQWSKCNRLLSSTLVHFSLYFPSSSCKCCSWFHTSCANSSVANHFMTSSFSLISSMWALCIERLQDSVCYFILFRMISHSVLVLDSSSFQARFISTYIYLWLDTISVKAALCLWNPTTSSCFSSKSFSFNSSIIAYAPPGIYLLKFISPLTLCFSYSHCNHPQKLFLM